MADQPLPYGIRAIWITDFLYPGWNRRRRDNGHLELLEGWRLLLHRILWGFERLTYIAEADQRVWKVWPVGEFFDLGTLEAAG